MRNAYRANVTISAAFMIIFTLYETGLQNRYQNYDHNMLSWIEKENVRMKAETSTFLQKKTIVQGHPV